MNIEEKAKAYDEALDTIKKTYHNFKGDAKIVVDKVFPELSENEDEKIRKELIEYLKQRARSGFNQEVKICNNGVAWLEKQGRIVEKFWTIQDAKKGDILANNKIVLIVDHIGDFEGENIIYSWYFADSNKFYGMGPKYPDKWSIEGFHPAPKEQRDFLFQKMKEAGYEWDAEKKELKKIEQKPTGKDDALMSLDEAIEHCKEKSCGNNACASQHQQLAQWLTELKEYREQKLAEWSENDELNFNQAIYVCHQYGYLGVETWLKSLKERMKGE